MLIDSRKVDRDRVIQSDLCIVGAGAAGILLALELRSQALSIALLESGGLILGAMANITYEQESVKLDRGDLLFLYTDGLSEAENPEGDMYDEERVEEFAVRNRDLDVGEMVERLAVEVKEFMNGMERKDDLTLLIARVRD